jgi:hypothetical protein
MPVPPGCRKVGQQKSRDPIWDPAWLRSKKFLRADYFPTLVLTRSGPKSLETSSRFILSPAHRDPLAVLSIKIFYIITKINGTRKSIFKETYNDYWTATSVFLFWVEMISKIRVE